MSVREVPPREWRSFLEAFSRAHRAWLASVTQVRPDGRRGAQVVERPLGAVTVEGAGIQVQFQLDSAAGPGVRIDAPSRLQVDETAEGAARTLEIDDEQGGRTRISLRVPAPPGLLDGIAPGEV